MDFAGGPSKGDIVLLNPAYLVKSRNGVFYLRWPLPRQLHPQKKPSQIKVSLLTRDPKKALRLARPLIHIGEHYNNVGIAYQMDYQELRAILQNHFRQLREQTKAEIDAKGGLNPADRAFYRTSLSIAKQAINTDTPLSFVKSDDELIARFIDKYGLAVIKGTDQHDRLERDIKRGYRRYLEDILEYDTSVEDFDLDPPPMHIPAGVPKTAVQKGMSLADTANGYVEEKQQGKNWAHKTKSEKIAHIELLNEILGADTDIRTLGAMDAKKVKDVLRVYPTNREKLKATRGDRPLSEILDLPNVPKLHTTSINKYLQSYGDMFNWAKQNGHVDQNIFAGLSIRQNKARSQDNRKAFAPEQIRRIISAILLNEDGLAQKAYQKWGPLIAIYTGARLNEISQLHLDDIKQTEGIWCFDFNDEGDRKSLKTIASRRLTPIHNDLIELGFLDHAEAMRVWREQKLFPTFTYDQTNGWGRHLSRHVNNTLLPKLQLKSKDLVFHSFRHTVVTQLMRAGVEEAHVKAIIGHSRQGVTQQHYFRLGYTIRQLNDALQQLSFNEAETEIAIA